MSEATDKLARSRLAIVQHVQRRDRRRQHEAPPPGFDFEEDDGVPPDPPYDGGGGWLAHMKHAVKTWWRYHPAHMAVDLANPLLRGYAQRKPVQMLAISAAAGAALTFARPWKLISLTTLGKQRATEAMAAAKEDNGLALAGFKPAERDAFLGMLRRVAENLDADGQDSPPPALPTRKPRPRQRP